MLENTLLNIVELLAEMRRRSRSTCLRWRKLFPCSLRPPRSHGQNAAIAVDHSLVEVCGRILAEICGRLYADSRC